MERLVDGMLEGRPLKGARRGGKERGSGGVRPSIGGIFTGSGADYDKPSLHFVGSGEGSQVYGWGLYGSNVRGRG